VCHERKRRGVPAECDLIMHEWLDYVNGTGVAFVLE